MTLTVPYGLVTNINSSINTVSVSAAERLMFAQSLKNTYLWLALINYIAIVPSVLRGTETEKALLTILLRKLDLAKPVHICPFSGQRRCFFLE